MAINAVHPRRLIMRQISKKPGSKRCLGFTLTELLIALSITAVIGVAVSSMLHAMAYGSTSESDKRRVNSIEQITCARIGVVIRSSDMVLSNTDEAMVLWFGDENQNGRPNLSELARVEWQPASAQIELFEARADLTAAEDTIYDFTDDFESITKSLAGSNNFPGMVWAKDITAFQTVLDDATVHNAKMVKFIITVQGKDYSSTATGIAALGTE